MAKSVAHMLLYKNTNRLGQRKVDLKEQCRRRLSNIRLDNFSKNRPSLQQEVNKIISSTVSADSELTFDEQVQMAEELFQEIWEEEIKSYEETMCSRAEEEAEWMECVPVPCPNCEQAEMIFESTKSRCGSCSFSFTHSHPSSFSLCDAIQSIQLYHKDRCAAHLSVHSQTHLAFFCDTCQFHNTLQ